MAEVLTTFVDKETMTSREIISSEVILEFKYP